MFYASFIHDAEEAEETDQSRLISRSSKFYLSNLPPLHTNMPDAKKKFFVFF